MTPWTISIIHAKDGKEADIQKALETIIEATQGEPGCGSCALFQVEGDPTRFIALERFTDEAALERHFTTEHVAAFRKTVPELIASPNQRLVLVPIAVGTSEKGRIP